MTARRILATLLLASLLLAMLSWATPALPEEPSKTVILVAKRQLTDPFYRSTVLVVRPMGGDQHIGFILNRPDNGDAGTAYAGTGVGRSNYSRVSFSRGPHAATRSNPLLHRVSARHGRR